MMKPEIEIYDTTLRDGSQGEGINFSVADKVRIAEKLDASGIHYIEGGWPGSNPKDIEFFHDIRKKKLRHARIAAFGSTRRKHVEAAEDAQVRLLIDAKTPVITIFGKSWLLHVKEVLNATPEENCAMIRDTVKHLKKHRKTVIYDAEHAFDGYKNDPEYALSTFQAAEEGGADLVVLCDTNGGCLPHEIQQITKEVCAALDCRVGIHTHDDIGLGVANALAAIDAGAVHVQGTINGYGERTGNCNLTTTIPNIALKMGRQCVPENCLKHLKDLSQFVDEIANVTHNPRQPWVGSTAFAHKGGMHVNAVQKVPRSFEHVNPEVVGNKRRILISDLAGRSNIFMKAREIGFQLDEKTPELKTILQKVKQLEHEGYEFEAAEASLAILIRRTVKHQELPFEVTGYHVSIRRDAGISVCQATVKVQVGDKIEHTVAEGDGPVNALDGALRLALGKLFPRLKKVRLIDYKVRILGSKDSTAAKTRVLIQSTDGHEDWTTVGVSENIIEASLKALVDSMEYRLMKKA